MALRPEREDGLSMDGFRMTHSNKVDHFGAFCSGFVALSRIYSLTSPLSPHLMGPIKCGHSRKYGRPPELDGYRAQVYDHTRL